jgi:hypothetical protein
MGWGQRSGNNAIWRAALPCVAVLAASIVGVAANSTAADGTVSPLRSQVIAPSGVDKIVAGFTAANNRANSKLSLAQQGQDEEGSAGQIDDSLFTIDSDAGFPSMTGATFYPVTEVPLASAVPAQSGYPAHFAVIIKFDDAKNTPKDAQTCAGSNVLDVFEKDSSAAPWRLSFEPYITPGLVKSFTTGSGGFATPVDKGDLEIPLGTVRSDVIAALNAYAQNGSYIDGFSKADFNPGRKCWGIDDLQADIAQSKAGKVTAAFSAAAAKPGDLTSYALPGGAALVGFTVSLTEVQTSAQAGGSLTVAGTKNNPGTYLVPAGTYDTITYPELCEVAAVDPARGAKVRALPRLVGAYCGYLAGAGS